MKPGYEAPANAISIAKAEARKGTICALRTLSASEVRNTRPECNEGGFRIKMKIEKIILQTSNGIFKIVPDEGPAFYARKEYFLTVDFDFLRAGSDFGEAQSEEFLDAGLATAVEIKASEYLVRAEQCRFNLTQKLVKKGFARKYIEMSLDFLESRGYLSDERFARAWLDGRKINHYEGRGRLLSELKQRGIDKEVADEALDAFFEENDEYEIGIKAYEKLLKQGKSEQKLISAMLNSGFSYKMIKNIFENKKNDLNE